MQSSQTAEPDVVQKQIADIKNSLNDIVETLVQEQIRAEMRGLKTSINSVFDTIETLQKSQSLFQKEINLRLSAITGHERRKSTKPTEPVFESLDDAIEYAKKMKGVDVVMNVKESRVSGPGKRT